MKDKKTLKEKIVQSVYMYETKKLTVETVIKIATLCLSGGIILIFGGVISDMFIESEIGILFNDFMKTGDFSSNTLLELFGVLFGEIPQWLFGLYIIGLVLGGILIASIVKNWNSIFHKSRSLFHYWFNL